MSGRIKLIFAATLLAGCLTACSAGNAKPSGVAMSIQLTSTAFADGHAMPAKYTCDGADVSPALTWTNAPADSKSFALIVEDPDAPAGIWVHWVVYDLPVGTNSLPENVARSQYIPGHARQGLNDFKRLGYSGPCPPPGPAHRYFFRLYALDTMIDLKPGASRKDLLQAMEGHVQAEAQLMGTYQRR